MPGADRYEEAEDQPKETDTEAKDVGTTDGEQTRSSSHCYLRSAHMACDQIRTPPGISSVIRHGLKSLEWERDAWKEACECIMTMLFDGEGGWRGRLRPAHEKPVEERIMSEPRKQLILTVGLPRSGKSAWAKEAARQLGRGDYPCPVVDPDSVRVRLAIHEKAFESTEEGIVWWVVRQMVETLFSAGHEYVILDATNLTEERRSQWLSDDWVVRYKVMGTDLLNRTAEEYEPLTEGEKDLEWLAMPS